MSGTRLLSLLLGVFGVLLVFTALLNAKPVVGELSTFNGATLSGLSVIGTQEVVGVLAVGFLFFNEMSDKSYGSVGKSFERLRESWLTVCLLMLIILSVTIVLKIVGFS